MFSLKVTHNAVETLLLLATAFHVIQNHSNCELLRNSSIQPETSAVAPFKIPETFTYTIFELFFLFGTWNCYWINN